jgi:diaminohydroxyphosphoribosylaminopyrimidine deaminase/5-amino-6-(5-phosphoribosylamino)uracil reductase
MNQFTPADYGFMLRAITLAKQGHFTTTPNPRVGCVLVKDNIIIGEGFHFKAGRGHAEVNAIAMAIEQGFSTQGATAYVTLEPCSHYGLTPPCAEGLINAEIKHVIAAMVDPNPKVSGRGLSILEQAGITTQSGLLSADAQSLNTGFIHLMTKKMPYVRCKLAASLDGKTAMASGESQWITSTEARRDVQRLRAQSCAVITGADSVLIDNARMTVRWSELGDMQQNYREEDMRQPVRVIIDSQNRLTPDLALFSQPSAIILMTTAIENSHQWPHFVEQVVLPAVKRTDSHSNTSKDVEAIAKINSHVDLRALLTVLAQRGINDVFVESGARLSGAFIEQDLVDELILYQAPKLMGAEGKSLVALPEVSTLSAAKTLNIKDIRMVGKDIRITANFVDAISSQ